MNFLITTIQCDFLSQNTNLWAFITAIASVIMAIAASLAVISYTASRKSQYLVTIESCSEEFRKHMRAIQEDNPPETIKRDILGLFHKQLFYIRNHYVPVDIKIEWIKTMHRILNEDELYNKKKRERQDKNIEYNKEELKKFEFLKFTSEDWNGKFDRVREFCDYNKMPTDDSSEKINIDKGRIKHYRKTYFNCWQRFWLRWNPQWQKAFFIKK